MNLEEFYSLAKSHITPRYFKQDALSNELIYKLLDVAHWSISDCNLQPTHFFIVQDIAKQEFEKKEKLLKACMQQSEILEAPLIVAFCGDRKAASHHIDEVLAQEAESGMLTEDDSEKIRLYVKMNFDQGVFGLTWLAKAIFSPLLRLFTALPLLPAVHKRYWLTKQVMLSAANFMLACESAGLAALPIQGFDERRVRKILGIPWNHVVPILVAVGYPAAEKPNSKFTEITSSSTRLPLEDLVHWNTW